MRKWSSIYFIFVGHFWTGTFAQFSFVHKWTNADYNIIKQFITHTYTECVIACTTEKPCELPGIRGSGDDIKTCYLLKGKAKTGLKKKNKADGVLLTEVIHHNDILQLYFLVLKVCKT